MSTYLSTYHLASQGLWNLTIATCMTKTHTTKQECGAAHFTDFSQYIYFQNIINCMNQSLAMSGQPKVECKWPCLQYIEKHLC
jgi:hypothetical protein